MSQYGDGDVCVVASRKERRVARKPHKCHACREAIAPGQHYLYSFILDSERSVDITRRCERCEVIYRHLVARIRKEGEWEEFCNDRLDCGHDYEERWEEPPPEWLAALAFWRPGDPLPELPKEDA